MADKFVNKMRITPEVLNELLRGTMQDQFVVGVGADGNIVPDSSSIIFKKKQSSGGNTYLENQSVTGDVNIVLPRESGKLMGTSDFHNDFTVGGNGNSITLSSKTRAISEFADNMVIAFVPIANNTGSVTLSIDGVSFPVRGYDGATLGSGSIITGCPILLIKKGAEFRFPLMQTASTGQVGVVKLTSSLASTSETLGATAKAVKELNDKKFNKDGGGSISGNVTFQQNVTVEKDTTVSELWIDGKQLRFYR